MNLLVAAKVLSIHRRTISGYRNIPPTHGEIVFFYLAGQSQRGKNSASMKLYHRDAGKINTCISCNCFEYSDCLKQNHGGMNRLFRYAIRIRDWFHVSNCAGRFREKKRIYSKS